MENEVIINIPNKINIDIGIPGRKGDDGKKVIKAIHSVMKILLRIN